MRCIHNSYNFRNSEKPTNYLEYNFLLLHEQRGVDIDSHVRCRSGNNPHSRLDCSTVQVRQLLLCNHPQLVHGDLADLHFLWVVGALGSTCTPRIGCYNYSNKG